MLNPSLFFLYLLSILYLETYLRLVFKGTLFTKGLIFSTVFGVVYAGAFHLLSSLMGQTFSPVVSYGFITLLTILFFSQLVYYKIFRTFYIVYSIGKAGDALEFRRIAVETILGNLPILIPVFFPLAWLYLVQSHNLIEFSKDGGILSVILISAVFHMFGLWLINSGSKELNSPYNLYHNIHQPEFSIQNLGLLTYMRIDLKRQLFGFDPKDYPSLDHLLEYNNIPGHDKWHFNLAYETLKDDYNVMDINFEKLAEREKDPKTCELHRFFGTRRPTEKNHHTGIFKDYNLILITAESLSHLAIRKDITPTLYKMVHEGFNFTNFYTPIWGVSTTDGEYVATTGLFPKPCTWSYSMSKKNLMPFSMGNQLKGLGYSANAYHNHSYDYFDRHLTHPNMGYQYKGVGQGLDLKRTWPESDLEMMEKTIPDYMDHDKFHAYYMTVSGHFRYRFKENQMAWKNRAKVVDLPFSDNVKAYLAAQVELDLALEHLLGELEKRGIAEKTLIAISSDHYPYGLAIGQLQELSGQKIDPNFDMYRNAFILYSKGMDPVQVNHPASSIDIIPTLSNLMGLEYDSRLLMGRDVFSTEPPLVMLSNRSFITEKGRFNSETGEFSPQDDFLDSEVFERDHYGKMVSDQVDARFLYSGWVLEKDYYRKVLGG